MGQLPLGVGLVAEDKETIPMLKFGSPTSSQAGQPDWLIFYTGMSELLSTFD